MTSYVGESNLKTVHPPHGFVRLVEWAGDELDVVNAARVSFAKQSNYVFGEDDDYCLSEADRGLIRYLLHNRHGTPFEMVWTKWHISAPIFVFREWHRHRMASVNEMSGRYVELEPKFYLPDDEHVRIQIGRPGHYEYKTVGGVVASDPDTTVGDVVRGRLESAYRSAFRNYEALLEMGVAKELARSCLPVATYSEMYWAVNLRGLLNFLSLRNDDRAQREIHDYASVMEQFLQAEVPIVHEAFIESGRIAP